MKSQRVVAVLAVLGALACAREGAPQRDCADLAADPGPGLEIRAEEVDEPGAPAHCRVTGRTAGGIGFVLALPRSWNGRFAMAGSRGFGGVLELRLLPRVSEGWAVAGSDTGHRGDPFSARWAAGHPERQRAFGDLAVHRTAEVSKALIARYYGTPARHAYFTGCSRGGGEALMAAQRHPADFDGIVARAPVQHWTGFAAKLLSNMQLAYPDPNDLGHSPLTRDNLALLGSAVLAACDALDGVADGVLDDPRDCGFRVAELPACPGEVPAPDCVTGAQRAVMERVYAPLGDAAGVLHPGQPFGGENLEGGWDHWIAPANPGLLSRSGGRVPSFQLLFAREFFAHFVVADPGFRHTDYDLTRLRADLAALAPVLDATDPDLTRFRDRGGRLIHLHGWADPGPSALASIDYYEAVQRHDPDVADYYRLFLMPGVLHCSGGSGPDRVDALQAVVDWVEEGRAPDRLVAEQRGPGGAVLRSRVLCPFPERAVYRGRGSTDDAASFACREPGAPALPGEPAAPGRAATLPGEEQP